jgi:hypothetical protein
MAGLERKKKVVALTAVFLGKSTPELKFQKCGLLTELISQSVFETLKTTPRGRCLTRWVE